MKLAHIMVRPITKQHLVICLLHGTDLTPHEDIVTKAEETTYLVVCNSAKKRLVTEPLYIFLLKNLLNPLTGFGIFFRRVNIGRCFINQLHIADDFCANGHTVFKGAQLLKRFFFFQNANR